LFLLLDDDQIENNETIINKTEPDQIGGDLHLTHLTLIF